MKRGQSWIFVTSRDNPNHPLIKKLTELGVNRIECIYATHWATDAGWILQNCDKNIFPRGGGWLGFTKKEAIKNIDQNFKVEGDYLYTKHFQSMGQNRKL